MTNPNDAAMRKTYNEPRLVEYGALTDLTRSSNASMMNSEFLMNNGKCTFPMGDVFGPKPC